jgi:hypothetical protein
MPADSRERIQAARRERRRTDPAWQEKSAALSQLPDRAFEALSEPERLAVRGYFALDAAGAEPLPTRQALASICGLRSPESVDLLVRRATAALLSGEPANPRARLAVQCTICGSPILRKQRQKAHACGPTCMAELRRRAYARWYECERRASEPRRRALTALPSEAFASLTERDRTIVRRCYGLDGEEPRTQRAVAAELQLGQDAVQHVLRSATARLLGWPQLDPGGQLRVPCSVCGTIINLRRRPANSKLYACSPACTAALNRDTARDMQERRRQSAVGSLRRQLERLPARALDELPDRDAEILRAYCGLGGESPRSPAELAHQYGLLPTSINRIIRKSTGRLFDLRPARTQDKERMRV